MTRGGRMGGIPESRFAMIVEKGKNDGVEP